MRRPGARAHREDTPVTYTTAEDVFTHLDQLRQQRAEAKKAEHDILTEIKGVLRTAATLQFDGQPINRTLLIAHAGLSRRTAYMALPPEQPAPEESPQ